MAVQKATSQKKSRSPRIAVIVADFSANVSERLLKGCLQELRAQGIPGRNWRVIHVPGAFELPLIALKFAQKKDIDAVICLGAVIRGETYHFELVADNCARGILEASLRTGKPVIFGVLSTDTEEQALQRSNETGDHKGKDAVQAVLEMLKLLDNL